MDARWLLLQLSDSAFPTGGFAHSGGLEAAVAMGEVSDPDELDAHLGRYLWNAGHALLPFVAGAYDAPRDVWVQDATLDAMMTNHVGNRASRTQGRAFAATCGQVFEGEGVQALCLGARSRDVCAHLAPVFGAVLASLGVERRDTLRLYLHGAARGLASASVRLGVLGPHGAQRLLYKHAATLEAVLGACEGLSHHRASTSSPLLDIVGASHDRLYARLFQS